MLLSALPNKTTDYTIMHISCSLIVRLSCNFFTFLITRLSKSHFFPEGGEEGIKNEIRKRKRSERGKGACVRASRRFEFQKADLHLLDPLLKRPVLEGKPTTLKTIIRTCFVSQLFFCSALIF